MPVIERKTRKQLGSTVRRTAVVISLSPRRYFGLAHQARAMVQMKQAVHTIKRFCTLRAQEQLTTNFDSLSAPLRNEARKRTSALREARDATVVAATEGSDDDERREALLKVRLALRRYSQLAATGDPAVQLSENGKPMENGVHIENDVTRMFGDDIDALKKDIFESNRQRVWMGWWGWF